MEDVTPTILAEVGQAASGLAGISSEHAGELNLTLSASQLRSISHLHNSNFESGWCANQGLPYWH